MIRHAAILLIAHWLLLANAGCQRAGMPAEFTNHPEPEKVTAAFLEAVRAGDDHKVTGYLSLTAREQTQAMEMVVAPHGSETASFRFTGSKATSGEAHVRSEWSDFDTDGLMHTDEIIWMLRNEADGWRIWGMQSKVFDDEAPVTLNFENPRQMLERQQRAEEELARRDRARGLRSEDDIPTASESLR